MADLPILSLITFLPLAGGVLLLFLDKRSAGLIRGWALAVTVIAFAASLPLWTDYSTISNHNELHQQLYCPKKQKTIASKLRFMPYQLMH